MSCGIGGVEGFKIEELGERAYEILDAMKKEYGEELNKLGLHAYSSAGHIWMADGALPDRLKEFIISHKSRYM